ncbi:MAG: hypothetical protein Q7T53_06760 [Deltaproteobacteria bacterium]|nr:hypothetical protein [Deltaproteobacteria bacterium]
MSVQKEGRIGKLPQKAEVKCEFCRQAYTFTREELKLLLRDL